ncbi:MAG: nickel-responsive transcriptional regulator NikR [Candidatus Thermoplasmatota archaeon]|nr:nickel-responsive transcriptional regulator NikR [Candidatus Thermoplasmatota archaeon]
MTVDRVGVSFEPELLKEFDSLISEKGYTSRSEAIRDLVRKVIIESKMEKEQGEVIGTLTYVYNHHIGEVSSKLMDLQHAHTHEILFNTHVHMDHDMCLEMLIVKGEASNVRSLTDSVKAIKGVKHGELVITRSDP